MLKIKAILTLLALIIVSATYAIDDDDKNKPENSTSASAILEGKYTYKGYSADEISILISEGKHTEVYNNGEFKVVSKMKWLAENKMKLEIVENTLPESNIKVGDKMTIEIEKQKGDKFYYKSTLNEASWKGCMIKIE